MKLMKSKIMSIVLCFAIALCSVPVWAVTQSEIDALEKERDELKTQRDNISAQLASLESDMSALAERKGALDRESELIYQDIQLLNRQVELYESVVIEKKTALEKAEADVQTHYELYSSRVRDMEEHSSWTYLSYILQADNLSELLARLMDVSDVMAVDESLRRDYIKARDKAGSVLAEYEDILALQKEKLEETELAKKELDEKIAESSRMIKALEEDIDAYLAYEEESQAAFEKVQTMLDEMAEELRKQQEAEEAAQHKPISGPSATPQPAAGYYMWPSSCTRITSPFGPRVHPIYGQLKPHTGVDIGAWYGTEIYAAASGTVTAAVLDFGSVGYGSYVAIYHPNGTTTLYAHMSSLAVSPGQTVSQGQIIGYVGSTGASNGPHIHFEIRQNGVCTDPVPYFNMIFSY